MLARTCTSGWWAVVSICVLATATAHAQDDEVAGDSRAEYAWGEGGGGGGTRLAEDPMRIMAYAGFGAGVRLVQNLDFKQTFAAPAYLDFGAALYLPGGDIRHGPAFFVSANVIGEYDSSVPRPFAQWALTPGYQILIPFQRLLGMEHDMLQLQGRIGIPIVLSGQEDAVFVSPGVELAAALQFKFLAGLGIYLEVQADLYGGSMDTVHPILAADLGFFIDYEVLE